MRVSIHIPVWHVTLLVVVAVLILVLTVRTVAQVPPHEPGTICYTPSFWCWAVTPGVPGMPCQCVYQNQIHDGVLG